MSSRFRIAACLALTIAAIAPTGAHATSLLTFGPHGTFVAAGPSATVRCDASVSLGRWLGTDRYALSGSTSCGAPVSQTCALHMESSNGFDTYDLAGTATATGCSASDEVNGSFNNYLDYRITAEAPAGTLWVAAPNSCTGVATTHLACTFTTTQVPK